MNAASVPLRFIPTFPGPDQGIGITPRRCKPTGHQLAASEKPGLSTHRPAFFFLRFYPDDFTSVNTQLFWSDTFFNRTEARVKTYFRFDIRLAKRIWNDAAELAFGVTNLTNHFHYEGGNYEVPRQFYVQLFYEF